MIVEKKSHMTYNEKRLNHHFRKTHMEQLNLITNFLGIKDKNIIITNEYDMGTHKELLQSCEVYQQIARSQLSQEELDYE